MFIIAALLCGLISCNPPKSKQAEVATENKEATEPVIAIAEEVTGNSLLEEFGVEDEYREYDYAPPSVNLFRLGETAKGGKFFSSLSDIYNYEEGVQIIPDTKGWSAEKLEYFPLNGAYRDLFLKTTQIAETDSVFIYNFVENLLIGFEVKDLQLIAHLSFYESPTDDLTQDSYYIGFEFDLKNSGLKDVYTSYVYVGKENPFLRGQMKLMKWKEVDANSFPSRKMEKSYAELLQNAQKDKTYLYEDGEFQYFIQTYKEEYTEYRRLIVLSQKNEKKLMLDRFLGRMEGSSPSPLNNEEYSYQWAGRLLKGEPPVVLGIEDISFGCEKLLVLDGSGREIFIQCDNRH